MLSDADVERFVRDGAIRLDGAVPLSLVEECRALLWDATGCSPTDRSTWTRPVVRIDGRSDAPFAAAANTASLHAAFDALAGVGRWSPLGGLGTFPIRFPSALDPGDLGWHIESVGTDSDGKLYVDLESRQRVLLLLFLFSDVGPDDAPTRIQLGSHIPAARLLADLGGRNDFFDFGWRLDTQWTPLPEAATGRAGDVWICHPFLVHAAQRNLGSGVKFMAQPPLAGTGPIDPTRPDPSPVEQAVALALR